MLFYTKDWLTGTAEMEPAEKGIYIDLICYQQINGSLPMDVNKLAKLCGLSPGQFQELWAGIKHKFIEVDGRLVNQRVKQVVEQTANRALKNKINGSLPRIIEKFDLKKTEKKQVYSMIYESINYNDFLKKSDSEIKQTLNQMVDQMVNYIANANGDANANGEEKEIIYPWNEIEFSQIWEFWKKYKKEQFRFVYKEIGEQGALSKLSELSDGKLEIAMLIIKQSIQNGWSGLFTLKGKYKTQEYDREQIFADLQKS